MKFFLIGSLSLFLFINKSLHAQAKYLDRNCDISFFSHTPVEDIKAKNSSAVSVLDVQSGEIEFSALIKAFEFEKAMMQEHFNENYMESEKFPKTIFKGTIENIKEVNLKSTGSYPVDIKGMLTIHGVSKEITIKGTIKVSGESLAAISEFVVNPEDYKIAIPSVVKEKIANEINVKVEANLQPYIN